MITSKEIEELIRPRTLFGDLSPEEVKDWFKGGTERDIKGAIRAFTKDEMLEHAEKLKELI